MEQRKEGDLKCSVSFIVSTNQSKENLVKKNVKSEKEENHNENLKLDVQSMKEIKESSKEIMEKMDVPKSFSKDTVERNDKKSDSKIKSSDSLRNENSVNSERGTLTKNNDLQSYAAMIAQAILKIDSSKSTFAGIYEYIEKYFPSFKKCGNERRNCLCHTLFSNDCFIKLHRPENRHYCNWAPHPSYYETFKTKGVKKTFSWLIMG